MTEKEMTQTSKFLSLVLRHKPQQIGIELNEQGWIEVETLLKAMAKHQRSLSLSDLQQVVAENNKQRFAFSEDGAYIRANQGHSIAIDLELPASQPPDLLYHGTAAQYQESIRQQGLNKMKRQHVHLSKDIETAVKVGSRHGKPVVIQVESGRMHADGFLFFLSENGVWLTDSVSVSYLLFPE